MEENFNTGECSLLLTLSREPPPAQRLREIVWAMAEAGCSTLFVDWGRSYPWGFDEHARSDLSYREELVPGLAREAEGRGMVLSSVFPSLDQLGFIAAIGEYRHAFHVHAGGPMPDVSRREGRELVRVLLGDLVALQPESKRLLVNWLVTPVDETGALSDVFGSFGLELLLRPIGALSASSASSALDRLPVSKAAGLKGIVLPAGFSFGGGTHEGLVQFREYRVRPENESEEPGASASASASHAPLRTLAGSLEGGGELSLLLPEEAALEYDRFSC